MAARAMWKGVIRFGDAEVPVKLYAAVEDRDIHFHLLHDQDMVRLKQRLVNADSGEAVPSDRLQKGYEFERNHFVLLDEEDLASLEPEASRDIAVAAFVQPAAINHQWYERPYWVGPDDDADAYFALVDALATTGLEGVVRWTMRKKAYVGALRAEQGYLALVTLRSSNETISSDELDPPEGRDLEKKERELAGKLLAALESEFDPSDYRDEYRNRVRDLIETKRKGGTVEVEEYEEPRTEKSLAESLAASLSGS